MGSKRRKRAKASLRKVGARAAERERAKGTDNCTGNLSQSASTVSKGQHLPSVPISFSRDVKPRMLPADVSLPSLVPSVEIDGMGRQAGVALGHPLPQADHGVVATAHSKVSALPGFSESVSWCTPARMGVFLADVEHHLCRMACRIIPNFTTRTGKAFMAVAVKGVTPCTSPVDSEEDADDEVAGKGHRTGGSNQHQELYNIIRSTIAASCALGHRSCQALWGPRGCGKHRLLRLIAREYTNRPNCFVMELPGQILRDDEAALRLIASQMLTFLKSPQSAALRAKDWSLRTGTFDFGHLFGFEKHLLDQQDPEETTVQGEQSVSSHAVSTEEQDGLAEPPLITTTSAYLRGGAASALPALQRALLLMKGYGTSLVVCIRQADLFSVWCDQLLYVLSGLMHDGDGHGGGMSLVLTSAAPDIQQMEKRLSSRLTCEARFVPLFDWTPRRLIRAVLTVIRDETQERLNAALPEKQIQRKRGVENKRRARGSRSRYAKGNANTMKDKEKGVGTPLESAGGLLKNLMAENVFEWNSAGKGWCSMGQRQRWTHQLVCEHERYVRENVEADRPTGCLTQPLPGRDVAAVPCPYVTDSEKPAPSPSLFVHPTLVLETLVILCDESLAHLDAVISKITSRSSEQPHETQAVSATQGLIERSVALSDELLGAGSTAPTVLTAVVDCLCKTCAGALELLDQAGRRSVLAWLDVRQRQEKVWPWLEVSDAGTRLSPQNKDNTTPPRKRIGLEGHRDGGTEAAGARVGTDVYHSIEGSAPFAVQQRWLTDLADAAPGKNVAGASFGSVTHFTRAGVAPLPPDLYDVLGNGRLVQLGYGAKEIFMLLFYVLMHHEAKVRRTVSDLLEDVSSSLGTKAAAVLDVPAYRTAVTLLHRWRILHVAEGSEVVSVCGSCGRLREFLKAVMEKRMEWCEEVLGLDAKEYLRVCSLL